MSKKLPHVPRKAPGAQRAAAALQQGLALHKAGNLEPAREIYEAILRTNPRNFDALQLLGTISIQAGQYEKAVDLFTRVLAVHSNNAALFNNRGVALFELKRFDEARASYARAVALKPDYAQAHVGHANALAQLRLFPDAVASYERGIQFKPDDAEAHCNLGVCLHEIGRAEDAAASYGRAISIDPAYAEAHSNLGVSLMALGRLPQALASYARALELKPDYAEAHYNRGNALNGLHFPEEAIASFERAIAIKPDYAQAHYNCGNGYKELRQLDKALAHYAAAIAAKPDYAQAHCNRGVTLHELQRLPEAIASYGQAVAIQPDYAEARWNQSVALLQWGDFQAGWALYESRWACAALDGARRSFASPLWLGHESLVNKTILLHAEQGLGDAIQFCRYAQMVKEAGAHVLLEVPGALLRLLTHLPGVDQLIERGHSLPPFDYHCPLMSLPLAFGTTLESIPFPGAYLRAEEAKVRFWRDKMGGPGRLKVGVVWNGGFRPNQPDLWTTNERRNIALDVFAGALQAVDVDFFSLQKGDPAESAIRGRELEYWPQGNFFNLANALHDFSDTAALIENLDLIVSVDTATAHLAAALGKPTWILSRFDGCWRWLRDRDDSPWYASARLYRQDGGCQWMPVLQRVANDLKLLKPSD